jgi:hypothetical protein
MWMSCASSLNSWTWDDAYYAYDHAKLKNIPMAATHPAPRG